MIILAADLAEQEANSGQVVRTMHPRATAVKIFEICCSTTHLDHYMVMPSLPASFLSVLYIVLFHIGHAHYLSR
jgi:hypothetical protein